MELRPHNFDTIDFEKDPHMILTCKFMDAEKLADRGEDPLKLLEGPYGVHNYLTLESKTLDSQFYLVGQDLLEAANLTRYLIYKCKKSDDHSLPFASTRQEFITHEDTIFVSGDEHLYSLTNKVQIPDVYSEELMNEISSFSLAPFWPTWAQKNDWLFYTFHSAKSTFPRFEIEQ